MAAPAQYRRKRRLQGAKRATLQSVSLFATSAAVLLLTWPTFEDKAFAFKLLALAGMLWIWFGIAGYTYLQQPSSQALLHHTEPFKISMPAVKYWSTAFPRPVYRFLGAMLSHPEWHTRRLNQHVEFVDRSLRVSTSMTIDLPTYILDHEIVVPIYEQRRGELVNSLHMLDSAGNRLSSLTQIDASHILMAEIDRIIVKLKPKNVKARPPTVNRWKSQVRTRAAAILASSSAADAMTMYEELFDAAPDANTPQQVFGFVGKKLSGDPTAAAILSRLIFRVAEYYPILVSLPPTKVVLSGNQPAAIVNLRLTASVSQSPFRTIPTETVQSRFFRRLKSVLYVVEPRLHFPLRAADQTRSYHLQVDAPEGMYFYELDVRPLFYRGKHPVRTVDANGLNVSGQQLQKSGHFYARDSSSLLASAAEISFKERLPGSISQSLLWSGLLTLVGACALISGGSMSDGVLSILFPVLFAGLTTGSVWYGLAQLNAPFGGRLVSRLSALGTLVLSVASVVIATAVSSSGDCTLCITTDRTELLGVWAVIVALSATNTLASFVLWSIDSAIEQWFMRRGTQLGE